jgi:hypothetical protein
MTMKMTRVEKRTYNEHELTTAAFIWTRGFKLQGVIEDPNRPAHKIFQFEDDGRIAEIVNEYLNGGSVPARQFARAMAELKALVYNGQASPRRR